MTLTTNAKTLYAGALRNTHAEDSKGLQRMKSQRYLRGQACKRLLCGCNA